LKRIISHFQQAQFLLDGTIFFSKKEKKDSRHHQGYLRKVFEFLETSGPLRENDA